MKLLSWGANSYGQLSHGVKSEQCLYPTEIVSAVIEKVVSISAGGGHSLLLDSEGALFGSGSNNNGQLANLENNTATFSKLEALQEFKLSQIECGWDSSFAITDDGSLVVWGSNKFGQLGISREKVTTTRHPVVLDSPKVIQVAAGLRHTAVVSSDGYVYTCGSSSKGQLGIFSSDGNLPKIDQDSLVRVEGVNNVVQVACGQHHTLAITTEGHVYGWGNNRRGQLGEGPPIFPTPQLLMSCKPGTHIKAGWTHSALLSDGMVKSWGRNNYSQLGHSYGQEQVATPTQVMGLRNVKQLELGSEHNLALLDNREIWSWGWNEHGNCGTGTVENVTKPSLISTPYPIECIAAGAGHNIALCQS